MKILNSKEENKTFGLLKKNSDWCPSSYKYQIPRKIETSDDQLAQARDQEEWCEAETKSCRRKKGILPRQEEEEEEEWRLLRKI